MMLANLYTWFFIIITILWSNEHIHNQFVLKQTLFAAFFQQFGLEVPIFMVLVVLKIDAVALKLLFNILFLEFLWLCVRWLPPPDNFAIFSELIVIYIKLWEFLLRLCYSL